MDLGVELYCSFLIMSPKDSSLSQVLCSKIRISVFVNTSLEKQPSKIPRPCRHSYLRSLVLKKGISVFFGKRIKVQIPSLELVNFPITAVGVLLNNDIPQSDMECKVFSSSHQNLKGRYALAFRILVLSFCLARLA